MDMPRFSAHGVDEDEDDSPPFSVDQRLQSPFRGFARSSPRRNLRQIHEQRQLDHEVREGQLLDVDGQNDTMEASMRPPPPFRLKVTSKKIGANGDNVLSST